MDRLFAIIGNVGDVSLKTGDTFSDRLNCQHTTFILVIFAILVTTKNYVGDPISCWCPAHFTESHIEYTNNICWVTNTYYLPFDEDIPPVGHPRHRIGYYQWVGLILIGQAVLFYLPRIVWYLFNKKSGIAVSTVTDAAVECQRKTDADGREKAINCVIKHLNRYLSEITRKHLLSNYCKGLWWYLYGNYIIILYLVVKLLYIINVVGQLFLLNIFLETDYNLYGFHVVKRLIDGEDWRTSNRFPRVTLCDFELRIVGNVNRYTVQCALPVNLFNEKIYIFLWFWFVAVALVTSVSFIFWTGRVLSKTHQRRYILSRLVAMGKLPEVTLSRDDAILPFVRDFLRRDGVFLIRLVARNASDLIAAEVICGLYDEYKGKEKTIAALRKEATDQQDEEAEVTLPS